MSEEKNVICICSMCIHLVICSFAGKKRGNTHICLITAATEHEDSAIYSIIPKILKSQICLNVREPQLCQHRIRAQGNLSEQTQLGSRLRSNPSGTKCEFTDSELVPTNLRGHRRDVVPGHFFSVQRLRRPNDSGVLLDPEVAHAFLFAVQEIPVGEGKHHIWYL